MDLRNWQYLWQSLRSVSDSDESLDGGNRFWRSFYPTNDHLQTLTTYLNSAPIKRVLYLGLAEELVIRAVLSANDKTIIAIFGVDGSLPSYPCSSSQDPTELAHCKRVGWLGEGVPRYPDLYIQDTDTINQAAIASLRAFYIVLFGQAPTMPLAAMYQWESFGDMSVGRRVHSETDDEKDLQRWLREWEKMVIQN